MHGLRGAGNTTVQDNVPGIPAGQRPQERLRRVGAMTAAPGVDVRAAIDPTGEIPIVTDEQGHAIPPMATSAFTREAIACNGNRFVLEWWQSIFGKSIFRGV